MEILLGLLFFSVLLKPGSSLMCEHCTSPNSDTCSGEKKECPYMNATCMTMTTEITIVVKIVAVTKSCSRMDACEKLKKQKGELLSGPVPAMSDIIPSFQMGAAIKEVTCSRAPPSFASFFPAFLGLLLMKFLF